MGIINLQKMINKLSPQNFLSNKKILKKYKNKILLNQRLKWTLNIRKKKINSRIIVDYIYIYCEFCFKTNFLLL